MYKSCQNIVQSCLIILIFSGIATAQYLPNQEAFWKIIPEGVEIPNGLRFYHHEPVFQMNGQIHSIYHNPAANPDPFGNANRDFPWVITSGLHQASKDFTVYKAASIPGPIAYYRGANRLRNNTYFQNEPPPIVWIYPENTVFMEFLVNKAGQTFEVRQRTKQLNGNWVPVVYRPFVTIDDLPPVNGIPARHAYKSITKQVVGAGVNETVNMVILPPRTTIFPRIFRPSKLFVTSETTDNFVPKNFLGNITNCTACHEQTGKHSRNIDPIREWYGNVRGSDQIFSFHIFNTANGSLNPNLDLIPIDPR